MTEVFSSAGPRWGISDNSFMINEKVYNYPDLVSIRIKNMPATLQNGCVIITTTEGENQVYFKAPDTERVKRAVEFANQKRKQIVKELYDRYLNSSNESSSFAGAFREVFLYENGTWGVSNTDVMVNGQTYPYTNIRAIKLVPNSDPAQPGTIIFTIDSKNIQCSYYMFEEDRVKKAASLANTQVSKMAELTGIKTICTVPKTWWLSNDSISIDGQVYAFSDVLYVYAFTDPHESKSGKNTYGKVRVQLVSYQTVDIEYDICDASSVANAIDEINKKVEEQHGVLFVEKAKIRFGIIDDCLVVDGKKYNLSNMTEISRRGSTSVNGQTVYLGKVPASAGEAGRYYYVIDSANDRIRRAHGIVNEYKYSMRAISGSTLEVYDRYLDLNWVNPDPDYDNNALASLTLILDCVYQRIYYKDITSVEFCPPFMGTYGYIQFIYSGFTNRSTSTVSMGPAVSTITKTNKILSENTIVVEMKNNEIARNIVEYINQRRDEIYRESGSNHISGADEIRKYKELADEGIITQEEFETKKKQLLEQ